MHSEGLPLLHVHPISSQTRGGKHGGGKHEGAMCLRKELVTSKNLEAWLLLSLPAIFNPDSCEQLQSLYQRVN